MLQVVSSDHLSNIFKKLKWKPNFKPEPWTNRCSILYSLSKASYVNVSPLLSCLESSNSLQQVSFIPSCLQQSQNLFCFSITTWGLPPLESLILKNHTSSKVATKVTNFSCFSHHSSFPNISEPKMLMRICTALFRLQLILSAKKACRSFFPENHSALPVKPPSFLFYYAIFSWA